MRLSTAVNILVAEGEPAVCRHLLDYLERLGYRADAATTGAAVLEALEGSDYAVLLLDSAVTLEDGGDLQRSIAERWPDISLVILAATPSVRAVIKALRGGAMDYIIKPYEITELTTIVPRAVERYFARRAAGSTAERSGAVSTDEVGA